MNQAKMINIYRQLLIIVGLIIFLGLLILQTGNELGFYVIGFIASAMIFFSVIGYCPMLFILSQLPWNKNPQNDTPTFKSNNVAN